MIGDEIRKLRLAKGYTQKILGMRSRLSESTIRLYELGLRIPNRQQIEKIAMGLEISPYVLLDTIDDISIISTMHTLFKLEDIYGVKIVQNQLDSYLIFGDLLQQDITSWGKKQLELENGVITKEEYDSWRDTYPKKEADDFMQEIRKLREAKQKTQE